MRTSDVPAAMRRLPLVVVLLALACDRPAPRAPATPTAADTEPAPAVEPEVSPSKQTDRAPLFELPTASGEPFALADALPRGPVVLVFYRGHW